MARKMKNSGIEWIGEIPEDWEYSKLKYFFDFEKGKNAALYTQEYIGQHIGDFPVYSGQTGNDGVMGKIDTYDYDIDECLFTTTVGAKVMTPKILSKKFNLSQNCLIMKKIKKSDIRYFYYLLISLFDYEKSHIPSYMQPSLRIDELNRYCFYVPEISEQQCIADFLDTKCAQIDEILQKTRDTIAEYKKLKQSIITQAVTKGVRGKRPMKDSGIEWIGEIPKEWEVKKLKYCAIFAPNCNTDKFNADTEVTFSPMECIHNGFFENRKSTFALFNSSYTQYQEGDIVFAKVTPCFENGNIAIMENLFSGFGFGSSELFIVRPLTVDTRYLFYFLQNDIFKTVACSTMTGTGGLKRVSSMFVRNYFVLLPEKTEQQEIAAYLDQKCAEIDKLIEKKEQLVGELENYKKSLIYEYVTGKKEVVI